MRYKNEYLLNVSVCCTCKCLMRVREVVPVTSPLLIILKIGISCVHPRFLDAISNGRFGMNLENCTFSAAIVVELTSRFNEQINCHEHQIICFEGKKGSPNTIYCEGIASSRMSFSPHGKRTQVLAFLLQNEYRKKHSNLS